MFRSPVCPVLKHRKQFRLLHVPFTSESKCSDEAVAGKDSHDGAVFLHDRGCCEVTRGW
jgi:hypothetical protein